jgi:XTP/dITP diphosphohydrolase
MLATKMKKIAFVTTNKHKFEEIDAVLREFGIELEHLDVDYPEDKEKEMKEISLEAAKNLANELNKALFVENTGLYFNAYNNFPGAQPKFVYNSLGFDGILKLLEGVDRSAYFKTVVAYCEPDGEPISFEGIMTGQISDVVYSGDKDAMPYDHIFIPDNYQKAIVDINMEEKNSFSQRGKATRLFGEYLNNK